MSATIAFPHAKPLAARLADPELLAEASYIDGAFVTAEAVVEVTDPATGEAIGAVPSLGADETGRAIDAASAALAGWRAAAAATAHRDPQGAGTR